MMKSSPTQWLQCPQQPQHSSVFVKWCLYHYHLLPYNFWASIWWIVHFFGCEKQVFKGLFLVAPSLQSTHCFLGGRGPGPSWLWCLMTWNLMRRCLWVEKMGSHGCFCLGSLKTIRFVMAKKAGDGHGEKPAFHLKLEISSLEFGFPRFFPQTQKTIFDESSIQVMMALYFATCCLWCFSALS